MEMPSVQIPVAGVLDGKLDDQLNAVWRVLNTPGFVPPLPNPIRILRHSGTKDDAEPIVLTDILQYGDKLRIKPFLAGLANRHNVLFDLETGALSQWSIGDVARQHTRGKAWFWEPAGNAVLDTALAQPDLSLILDGRELFPLPLGQFLTEADTWRTEEASVGLHYRLKFEPGGILRVRRKWTPAPARIYPRTLPGGRSRRGRSTAASVECRTSGQGEATADGRTLKLGDHFASRILVDEPSKAKFAEDAQSLIFPAAAKGAVRIVLRYKSDIPIDRFPDTADSNRRAQGPADRGCSRLPRRTSAVASRHYADRAVLAT